MTTVMEKELSVGKFKVGKKFYYVKQISDRPYWVSKCGEIISTVKGYPRLLRGGNSSGYRSLIITRGGPRDLLRHHHLVMRYWVGPRPSGMVINHKNGIKTDNRLENLEYCTPRQNRDHAKINRLYSSGSRCSWSKLKEEEVGLIREAHKIGMSLNHLARAFRVSKKAILQVTKGRTWMYF